MDITIVPSKLKGNINAIPSKSQAHRFLICASFASSPTEIICPETNRDIEATVNCLQSLGAQITPTDYGYHVCPVKQVPESPVLNCYESGSTLRFLLPIVGALGAEATIIMEGRLAERPIQPLWELMQWMGCYLEKKDNTIKCCGQLRQGHYRIDGSISSQFISGLMFAHWILGGCTLEITGQLESRPYIELTKAALAQFENYHSPEILEVEGDWSNGAFWLAAKALGNDICVTGLNERSIQGDRAVCDLIPRLQKENATIDARDIPDLVPILSVIASANHGAVFTNIRRLRLKESDRVLSTIAMLENLGGKAIATRDTLTVFPCQFTGGTVDSMNDHRIAMSAAIASTVACGEVTILGMECVNKSYPMFWEEFTRLGGKI